MISTLKVPANRRDHRLGSLEAPVILVEYGDYECPHTAKASSIVDRIVKEFPTDLCYVFRHFPLTDLHPHAAFAALAAEAAGQQLRFWDMHHVLLKYHRSLKAENVRDLADNIGLEMEKFMEDLESDDLLARIRTDIKSGDDSGVDGTPTFYFNGLRFDGPTAYQSMREAVLELKWENQISPDSL